MGFGRKESLKIWYDILTCVQVLWWATRMTFNSYRILRHMTRLLHVSGDINLAKRTLRLYVQVVSKAWQAGDAGVGVDADTNQKWVETLVYGIRLLCKNASSLSGLDGIEDVREAESLIEKAYSRLDKEDNVLCASLLLAEGVCQSVYALKRQFIRPACNSCILISTDRTRFPFTWATTR